MHRFTAIITLLLLTFFSLNVLAIPEKKIKVRKVVPKSVVRKIVKDQVSPEKDKENSEEGTLVRFHLAADIMGSFTGSGTIPQQIIASGDVGLHLGINLKIDGIEWSVFTGPELSLNMPIANPYAKTWMAGTELTGEIADPLRWAIQLNVSWQWYSTIKIEDGIIMKWGPGVQIPIQAGVEITLVEGKRSELSLQGLCGIAPAWNTGQWSLGGACAAALHANL